MGWQFMGVSQFIHRPICLSLFLLVGPQQRPKFDVVVEDA
jgi:hypothetical protein